MNELRTKVELFHKAFTLCERGEFEFELLGLFPTACCEYASLLLATFLYDKFGVQDIEVVCGEGLESSYELHTWLFIDGRNVDITAQQFDDDLPNVLVSTQGGWHKRFRVTKREMFNREFMEEYASPEKEMLSRDYKLICSNA